MCGGYPKSAKSIKCMHPELWVVSPGLISAYVHFIKLKNRITFIIDIGSFETLNPGCMRTCWWFSGRTHKGYL